jgi:hypothetical protein
VNTSPLRWSSSMALANLADREEEAPIVRYLVLRELGGVIAAWTNVLDDDLVARARQMAALARKRTHAQLLDEVGADGEKGARDGVAYLSIESKSQPALAPHPQADHRFWLVRGALAVVASEGRTIHYQEAAALCSMKVDDLIQILKAIQAHPIGEEPDLSAVVVGSTGHPGAGWAAGKKWNKAVKAEWSGSWRRGWRERCSRPAATPRSSHVSPSPRVP